MRRRNRGPGPGQVQQWAEEVKGWGRETPGIKGVKAAIAWVMADPMVDDHDKDPITGKQVSVPPDMRAIGNAAKRAGNGPESDPKLSAEYCAGVKACLDWITGLSDGPPEQWTDIL